MDATGRPASGPTTAEARQPSAAARQAAAATTPRQTRQSRAIDADARAPREAGAGDARAVLGDPDDPPERNVRRPDPPDGPTDGLTIAVSPASRLATVAGPTAGATAMFASTAITLTWPEMAAMTGVHTICAASGTATASASARGIHRASRSRQAGTQHEDPDRREGGEDEAQRPSEPRVQRHEADDRHAQHPDPARPRSAGEARRGRPRPSPRLAARSAAACASRTKNTTAAAPTSARPYPRTPSPSGDEQHEAEDQRQVGAADRQQVGQPGRLEVGRRLFGHRRDVAVDERRQQRPLRTARAATPPRSARHGSERCAAGASSPVRDRRGSGGDQHRGQVRPVRLLEMSECLDLLSVGHGEPAHLADHQDRRPHLSGQPTRSDARSPSARPARTARTEPSLRTGSLATCPLRCTDAPSDASALSGPARTASTRRPGRRHRTARNHEGHHDSEPATAREPSRRSRAARRPATHSSAAPGRREPETTRAPRAAEPQPARADGASLRSSGSRSFAGIEVTHGRQT